jgi:hypothetical protein
MQQLNSEGYAYVIPGWAIQEGGLTEVIDKDDQVDQNDYSADCNVSLGGTYSGEILGIALFTSETGAGAILKPNGRLYIFDADPGLSAGDTAFSSIANANKAIGVVDIATTDWEGDAVIAVASKSVAIPFHAVNKLYFAWFHKLAASFNDAGGDDEELHLNFWYRRDS